MLLRVAALSASPSTGGVPLAPSSRGSRISPRGSRISLIGGDDVSPLFQTTLAWGTEEEKALAFLKLHQPPSDGEHMSETVLKTGVQLALQARAATSWGQAVPWDIFLNDVLPYAVLNEARDNWRPLFYDTFMPLVSNASSTAEAALRLNSAIWSELDVKYEAQLSPHVTGPLEAVAYKRASCTGLSVILIDACRAVGIPARMGAVGAWAPPEHGNHNWVEVYVDDHWEFTGAFDGDGEMMNKTWFTTRVKGQDASNESQRVYATSWRSLDGGVSLPDSCLSTGGSATVNAIDRTEYYNNVNPPGEDYDEGTEGGDGDEDPSRRKRQHP